jgi:hypothetical protein
MRAEVNLLAAILQGRLHLYTGKACHPTIDPRDGGSDVLSNFPKYGVLTSSKRRTIWPGELAENATLQEIELYSGVGFEAS